MGFPLLPRIRWLNDKICTSIAISTLFVKSNSQNNYKLHIMKLIDSSSLFIQPISYSLLVHTMAAFIVLTYYYYYCILFSDCQEGSAREHPHHPFMPIAGPQPMFPALLTFEWMWSLIVLHYYGPRFWFPICLDNSSRWRNYR